MQLIISSAAAEAVAADRLGEVTGDENSSGFSRHSIGTSKKTIGNP